MIYPSIRISDLERRREEKRQSFLDSRSNLIESIKEELRPASLLKNHKKILLSAALFLIPAVGAIGKMGKAAIKSKGKTNLAWSLFKAGWFWKLIKFGMMIYGFVEKSSRPGKRTQ